MAGLSGDAFVDALQSDAITLYVGEHLEPVSIPTALLKCETISKLVDKGEGSLSMQNEPVAAVKFFVVWCFQDRLQPLHTNATVIERKQHKNKLMDLWLFCARYDIPKLQNLALQALYTLFPQLLEKEDIKYAWAKSPFGASGLKWLVVYAMVAKIEEGNANIDSYAELAGEEGFMVMVYEALKQWATCEMPKTPKKGRTKWSVMCGSEDVREVLLVDEAIKPTPATPKRSAPESGGGSSAKKARGFKGMPQGAMIDLTDD